MSLIDPSQLPGEGLRPWVVAADAKTLSGLGTSISDAGSSTLTSWQRISGSYQSDGAEGLYDVMTPVGTATTAIGDGFATVSAALTTYAEETTPIQKELAALKAEAQTFVFEANHYKAHDQISTDPWVIASGAVTGNIMPTVTIDSWDQDQDMVDKNNALIRRGADLAERWLQAQQKCAAAILGAAGQAPDSKTAQMTPAQLMAAAEDMMPKMPWEGEKDISTPWGSTGSRQESCGEKTLGFPAHLVGGVFTGAYKMVQGVSTLLTGYDGTGVPWYAELAAGAIMGRSDVTADAWKRAGDTYSSAWLSLGHLANNLNPLYQAADAFAMSPLANYLPDAIKKPLVDNAHADYTAAADTIGGLVGLKLPDEWWDAKSWDGYNIAQAWVDNPGGAAGESAFNIGSFFIPGGGEASAAAHGAGAAGIGAHGAEAATDAARAGTEGLEAAGRAAGKGDAFVDALHGVTESDLSGVVKGIDDGTLRGIDHLDFDPADIPVNDVHIPDDVAGVQKEWAGSDAPPEHVPEPAREPALVGAGHDASAADSASAAGDTAHSPKSELGSSDSPVEAPRPAETSTGGTGSSHESTGSGSGAGHDGSGSGSGGGSGSHGGGHDSTGGGSGHDGSSGSGHDGSGSGHDGASGSGHDASGHDGTSDPVHDGPGTGHDASGHDGTPAHDPAAGAPGGPSDPVHSGDARGPGWDRVPDEDINPKDLHYGEPMHGSGHSTYPTNMPSETARTISDPAAPYGRFPDGTALNKAQYDERFTFDHSHHGWADNGDNFPPNHGAVRGTRVAYDDMSAYLRDYGSQMDRIGYNGGDFLGVKVDGQTATFEQRSLPVSSLGKPLTDFELTGKLPQGWRIEISEIDRAFGRDGGGLQALIRHPDGTAAKVNELLDRGILK